MHVIFVQGPRLSTVSFQFQHPYCQKRQEETTFFCFLFVSNMMTKSKSFFFSAFLNICSSIQNHNMLKISFQIIKEKSIQDLSSHFEYLEKQIHGFDVTWQPIRKDFTAHARTDTLSQGYSVINQILMSKLVSYMHHLTK